MVHARPICRRGDAAEFTELETIKYRATLFKVVMFSSSDARALLSCSQIIHIREMMLQYRFRESQMAQLTSMNAPLSPAIRELPCKSGEQHKTVSKDYGCPNRDWSRGPSEQKSRALPIVRVSL